MRSTCALGRKNWLFIGHPEAGTGDPVQPEAFVAHGSNPYDYLRDVLSRLHRARITGDRQVHAEGLAKQKGRNCGRASDKSTPGFRQVGACGENRITVPSPHQQHHTSRRFHQTWMPTGYATAAAPADNPPPVRRSGGCGEIGSRSVTSSARSYFADGSTRRGSPTGYPANDGIVRSAARQDADDWLDANRTLLLPCRTSW